MGKLSHCGRERGGVGNRAEAGSLRKSAPPSSRCLPVFDLAVQRLNRLDGMDGRGAMDCSVPRRGWRVSQVESLLNMPKRDITRSCYADRKRGGAGILKPADGTWGRCNYNVEDIAWLYLVKLQHEQGYSLPEIAERMDTTVGVDALCGYLDAVADRAAEAYEGLREKRERARVLRCALNAGQDGAHDAVEHYLMERLGADYFDILCLVMKQIMMPDFATGCTPSLDAEGRERLLGMLDEPGIDLAIELWAGPGASERLRDAFADW